MGRNQARTEESRDDRTAARTSPKTAGRAATGGATTGAGPSVTESVGRSGSGEPGGGGWDSTATGGREMGHGRRLLGAVLAILATAALAVGVSALLVTLAGA